MSERAYSARELPDSSVEFSYVPAGELAHAGRTLHQHYQKPGKTAKLLALGQISVIGRKLRPSPQIDINRFLRSARRNHLRLDPGLRLGRRRLRHRNWGLLPGAGRPDRLRQYPRRSPQRHRTPLLLADPVRPLPHLDRAAAAGRLAGTALLPHRPGIPPAASACPGCRPATEVRLDNRRKRKLSKRMRIRPQNGNGRELTRHGIPIPADHTNMFYFNELLRAHHRLNPEPALSQWLNGFLELSPLLKARQTVTEGVAIADQAALVPHDLKRDLTQRLDRLTALVTAGLRAAATATPS